MKKLAIATVVFAAATAAATVQADPKLVPADGSELSQLCIAAVDSHEALGTVAGKFGYGLLDLAELRCNGLTISRFAAKYRTIVAAASSGTEPEGYILKPSDDSPLAALCVAAASSEEEFTRLKEAYFSKESNLEKEVMCNGVPLKKFAQRFRGVQTIALTQR